MDPQREASYRYFSIVVPAFNEESRLPKSLEQLKAFVRSLEVNTEVIVVDDGSTDNTSGVVQAYMQDWPSLRLIRARHGGKGAAVRTGILASGGQFVVLIDADLAIAPRELYRFDSSILNTYDVAIGSRAVRGAKRINESRRRYLMSRVFSRITQTLALPGIHDSQCGFKVIRRDVALKLCRYQTIEGFGYDVEYLAIARVHGFRIGEVPVTVIYEKDNQSKVRPIRDAMRMIGDLRRVRSNVRKGQYSPSKVNMRNDSQPPTSPKVVAISPNRIGAPVQSIAGGINRDASSPTLFDRLRTQADVLSGGRGALILRLVSYVCVSGFSAIVNLTALWLLFNQFALDIHEPLQYIIATVVAGEVSTIANFIPNDLITFRHLPGHARSPLVRFARFHVTAVGGAVITVLCSFLLHLLGLPGLVPQIVAIVVAFVFNFIAHHVFTYRAQRDRATATPVAVGSEPAPAQAGGEYAETVPTPTVAGRLSWLLSRPSIAYLVTFMLLYSTVIVVPYGFADDYAQLYESLRGVMYSDLVTVASEGRPTQSLLKWLTFMPMSGIGDLRFLRFASVVGIALVALMLYQSLVSAGWNRRYAWLAPVFICAMPSFQLFASWAVCAYYPYAIALAGLSVWIVEKASRQKSVLRLLLLAMLAVLPVLLSLSIDQPAAMAMWVFAAIAMLIRDLPFSQVVKQFALYLSVMGAALAGDFGLSKLDSYILLGPGKSIPRTMLTQDVGKKARWFLNVNVVDALNLSNFHATVPVAIAVGAFCSIGLLLYFRGNVFLRIGKFVIAVALVPLSATPSLIIDEYWTPYRTQVATTSLVALFAAAALLAYVRLAGHLLSEVPSPQRQSRLAVAALLCFTIVTSALAIKNVATEMVIPNYIELRLMASQLNAVQWNQVTGLYLVESERTDSIAPFVRYDEFGTPSSMNDWSIIPMAYLILIQTNPSRADIPMVAVPDTAANTPPAGIAVINMHTMAEYRFWIPPVWDY